MVARVADQTSAGMTKRKERVVAFEDACSCCGMLHACCNTARRRLINALTYDISHMRVFKFCEKRKGREHVCGNIARLAVRQVLSSTNAAALPYMDSSLKASPLARHQ